MKSTDVYAELETLLEEYSNKMVDCCSKLVSEEREKLLKGEIDHADFQETLKAADRWLYGI